MSGGLESIAAASDDMLIPGLNFKLPQGASYVSQRRFSTFFPQGSNIYSTTGTRLIRFVLSDATNLLDLSTFRLAFQLSNTDGANYLQPTGHPGMCWFQRCRIYVGGCLCEDILLANRVSGMLNKLKPPARLWSEALELLGQASETPGTTSWVAGHMSGPYLAPLGPGTSRTIITPIFSGLLQTHYLLPGRFPITIELELVNNPSQCLAAGDPYGSTGTTARTFSQSFSMQNVRILCDVVTVDNAVQEELSRVLLSGGALPMHFSSYSSTMHNLQLTSNANQSWSVTLSRAFSRIKDIWVTFDSDASHGQIATESSNFLNWHGKPDWNVYGDNNLYNTASGEGWRFQMTTGSLIFPDLPMSSSQEAWYQLSKVLGMASNIEGVGIPPGEWLGTNFILSLDMEKMASSPGSGMAAFTGLSTRNAGDTLRFAFDNVTPYQAPGTPTTLQTNRALGSVPQRMYITLHMDLVLEMRAEGCVLLD